MLPLPHRYNAIDTLYGALSAPTVARMNVVHRRNSTPLNMDANAASGVQPAAICCSALGSTKMVEEMLVCGARACGWGSVTGLEPAPFGATICRHLFLGVAGCSEL